MQKPVNPEELLEKYFSGRCTPDEAAAARQYMADPANDGPLDRFMETKWDQVLKQDGSYPMMIPAEDRYKKIKGRLFKERKLPALLFKAAASILLVLAGGSLYLNRVALLDIFFPVKTLTVSTKPGEQLELTLPDGSKVWLNTASTISYPEVFRGATRNIKLTGEAFFQVKPDPRKPFFVHSRQFYARVLGTSFNVKAYPDPDEDVYVTVTEGKVAVGIENENMARKEFTRLTRNHRVMFDPVANILFQDSVATGQGIAWRDGKLSFHQASLKEMATALERWFAVKIDVTEAEAMQCSFSATYYKGVKLRDILEAMQIMGKIAYEFTDDGIKIRTKNNCKTE